MFVRLYSVRYLKGIILSLCYLQKHNDELIRKLNNRMEHSRMDFGEYYEKKQKEKFEVVIGDCGTVKLQIMQNL